jgi:hypothetical protein
MMNAVWNSVALVLTKLTFVPDGTIAGTPSNP